MRKQTGRKSEYEKGEYLICKDRKKLKSGQVLNVNYKYEIVKNNGKFLTLQDIASKEKYLYHYQTLTHI